MWTSILSKRAFLQKGNIKRFALQVTDHQYFHGLTSETWGNGPFPLTSSDLALSAWEMTILTLSGSKFIDWLHLPHYWIISFNDPHSSDGPQPHFITVQFPRKIAIQVRSPSHPGRYANLTIFASRKRKLAFFWGSLLMIRILLRRYVSELGQDLMTYRTSK